MAMTWERLYGDTSKFAVRVGFLDDPDNGDAATEAESLSWGSLQVWVHGRNLCAHQFAGDIHTSAHWYLIPLLEWFVANWDPLFHEERLPNRVAGAHALASLERTAEPPPGEPTNQLHWEENWHLWWTRHCLDAARVGGPLPSLCLRRWQDLVEISWSDSAGAGHPAGWTLVYPPGAARLPIHDVAQPLHALLTDASSFLLERSAVDQRFVRLSAAVAAIGASNAERRTWLLGVGDSFDEMRSTASWLLSQIERKTEAVRDALLGSESTSHLFLQPFPAALMFGATSPRLSVDDRLRLVDCMADAATSKLESEPLNGLVFDVPLHIDRPWDQAETLADIALEELEVENETLAVDLGQLLDRLGVHVADFVLNDASIRAVAIAGDRFRSSIFVNTRHPSNQTHRGRRFTLAHELCHLLFDRGFARSVLMPSGPWAPLDVEKRANAFAATFLMPRDKVRAFVAATPAETARDLVDAVARRFDTSFTATLQHLHNIAIVSESDRDSLLDSLGGQ